MADFAIARAASQAAILFSPAARRACARAPRASGYSPGHEIALALFEEVVTADSLLWARRRLLAAE